MCDTPLPAAMREPSPLAEFHANSGNYKVASGGPPQMGHPAWLRGIQPMHDSRREALVPFRAMLRRCARPAERQPSGLDEQRTASREQSGAPRV
jgi:hypothetical protein